MNQIIQIQNITKEELLSAIGELVDSRMSSIQKANKEPKLHSIKDLAAHCDVAELTIRNWIKEGKLKAKTIGRRIFIEDEDFQNALSDVKSLKYQRA